MRAQGPGGGSGEGTGPGARRKRAAAIDARTALGGFGRMRAATALADARAEDNRIPSVDAAFGRTTGDARAAGIGRDGRAEGLPVLGRLVIAPLADDRGNGAPVSFPGIPKALRDGKRDEAAIDAVPGRLRARVQTDLAGVLAGGGPPVEAPAGAGRARQAAAMARRIGCARRVCGSAGMSDLRSDGARGLGPGASAGRGATAVAHAKGRRGPRVPQPGERVAVRPAAAARVSLPLCEGRANPFGHAVERREEGLVDPGPTRRVAGGLRIAVPDDGLPRDRRFPDLFPDPVPTRGTLMRGPAEGPEAAASPLRGAAGTLLVIDVPAGVAEP